jgi:hypothetical protein
VQDNGTGNLSSQATITINLNNINEPPIIYNQAFNVNQFASNGSIVGTVLASDPDLGQLLTYAIIDGNSSNAFSINFSTGEITVNNKWALNYYINPVFQLKVSAQDNGTAQLTSYANITINVIAAKLLRIVSVPRDTVSLGLLYSYLVEGWSENGTMLSFSCGNLPNWLTFIDNGNSTGTLGGTPGVEDIGNYQIILTGKDGIYEVQQVFSIEVKSTLFESILNQTVMKINIFPNPVTNGILNVKFEQVIPEQFELSIIDMAGKRLLLKHYENANSLSVDVSAYLPATYIIQIRSLYFQFSDKFIIR